MRSMKKRAARPPAPAAPPAPDLFRIAFHNSPALQTVARAADRRFVEVNDTFLKILGYAREELIGKTAIELGLWVSPEREMPFRTELAERGFVRGFEVDVYTKTREIRSILLSADVVRIDGEPHFVAAGVDITERKRAEAALRLAHEQLRQSEERFSRAFHANPAMMTITRFDNGRFVSVNESFLRAIGYATDEVVGHTAVELNLHARADQRGEFFRRMKEHGFVRDMELVVRAKDGRLCTLLASGELTQFDGVPHMLTVGLDISGQKQAEQALRESEARLRALYEGISAAAMVHDESGFIQVNTAAVRLFGAERPQQIIGLHPGNVSPPMQPDGESSFAAAQRHMARALERGTHRFEWICRRLDATEFPVEVTLTALQLEGRQLMQAVVLDLSERKRAETELQLALAKERELNQLKSDFVSLVSHEFRTPLEVIMSSADNLERYHERLPAEKRSHLLRTIHRSVARMSDMMEEVLLLGRLESGATHFQPAAMDLVAFCQRMRDEMASATNNRCRIALHVDPAVSAATPCGDEAVVRHILTNLISNAVKYSAAGEPVELALDRDGRDAVFCVRDRGCGIPAADQARLFHAFHRGSNVRHVPGTGLGLVIVQRSVALHGGTIAFTSEEGRGTTFTVRLPIFDQMNPRRAGE